jgi:hypothetical protein
MENRIDVVLTPENKEPIFQACKSARAGMPYLTKISEEERKALPKMDDARKPFVLKSLEFASINQALDPGSDLLKGMQKDYELYTFLTSVENELRQLLEMVTDTKQLAGSEAYEVARFIYMKAKMNVKMGIPGSQVIAEELGHLFKHSSNVTKITELPH